MTHSPGDVSHARRRVKIVSLLPSATEIVFALGLGESLEGRSFECDFPTAAERVADRVGHRASRRRAPDRREIDEAVSTRVAAGESIYTLDAERIRAIQPDVILAQDLCEVCAVPSGAVTDALDVLGCHADVRVARPVEPRRRHRVRRPGRRGHRHARRRPTRSCATCARASPTCRHAVDGLPPPAGARARVGRPAVQRRALDPRHAARRGRGAGAVAAGRAVAPDGVVGDRRCRARCRAVHAVRLLPRRRGRRGRGVARPPCARVGVAEIWALDANAYFSRPGPRVVDGVELLASVLHPDAFPARSGATRLR